MKSRHQDLLEELVQYVEPKYYGLVFSLATYLDELGYHPRRKKAVGYVLEFYHPRLRKGIAKMRGEKDGFRLNLRFSAATDYTEAFAATIGRGIGHMFSYKEPVCGHCMACGPLPRTYRYTAPDGTELLFCGSVALPLVPEALEREDEIKGLLLRQHEHFLACGELLRAAAGQKEK